MNNIIELILRVRFACRSVRRHGGTLLVSSKSLMEALCTRQALLLFSMNLHGMVHEWVSAA